VDDPVTPGPSAASDAADHRATRGAAGVHTVRFVVVNFNGGALVLDCLESVFAQRWSGDLQVVVVDNASTDQSRQTIEQRFAERVHMVTNPDNRGFVAANQGMGPMVDLADPDAVALVNPDATLAPDWLERLVQAFDEPSVGAVSPCMVFADPFVDVDVRAPAEPAGADPRTLAVRLTGITVEAPGTATVTVTANAAAGAGAGADLSARLHAADGVHDPEQDGATTFRWLADHARLGVPVPRRLRSGASPTDPVRPSGPPVVHLTLAAPATKQVELRCGDDVRTVTVGPEPTTHDLPLTGAARDLIANAGSLVFDDATGADRGHFAPVDAPFDRRTDLFAWCGGGVLLHSAYLADIGVFEPSLFLYYEDTDLAWRGRARGWRHVYEPEARMHHVQGASGGAGSDLFIVSNTRNRLIVALRNGSRPLVRRAFADTFAQVRASLRHEVIAPLARARRPQTRMLRLRLRALNSLVPLLPATLRARRQLASRRRLPLARIEADLEPRAAGH
jgi:GT2 family glycosyltransferase